MAGIDNITAEILKEAGSKAEALIADAESRAEALIADANKQGEDLKAKAREKADANSAAYAGRITSQAGLRQRKAVLKTKQDIISGVIDAAMQKLASQDAEEYFDMLLKLVGSHAGSGDGEILLSRKDLDRLPEDFAEKAGNLAKNAGGTLKVSSETADIENGFILRYGGIEENCTLKALFAEKRDELCDVVAGVLWQGVNTDG